MEHTFEYKPQGTCSVKMVFTLDDNDTITNFDVVGGCPGNLQGVKALIIGMSASDVVSKLSGIRCRTKITSCPDQLAVGLKAYLDQKNAK